QRTLSEIRRADSSFHTTSCSVKTDGASLIVTFPGLSMGIFSGDLQFTVYKGTNLLRMDAAAKTSEQWVAYKYDAGLKGFSTDLTARVTWRDTGGHPQAHQFGGVVNQTLSRVKAQNRLIVAESSGGARVHARRYVQTSRGVQDVRQPLPSRLHRTPARVRIARYAIPGSDRDEVAGAERDRSERLPFRASRERRRRAAPRRSEGLFRS